MISEEYAIKVEETVGTQMLLDSLPICVWNGLKIKTRISVNGTTVTVLREVTNPKSTENFHIETEAFRNQIIKKLL